ncbi:MAG: type II secretion system protein N [Gammaproteobacteria bacterium]|nr:type II secretion system protein N [Gammaproteobacteria bacterium]
MNRQRVWQLAGVGLAVYLVVLIATVPAAFVWRLAAPADATAAGIEGTAWRGGASTAVIAGTRLTGLRWSLQPLELLRARLGLRFDTRLDDGFARGRLAVSPGGQRIWLHDTQAALALQPLATAAGYRGVAGQLSIALDELVIVDEWPERLQARIGIGQLVISDLGRDSLGDFALDLAASDGRVRGELADRGGPVEVRATLRLEPDRSYELEGLVQPRPQATQGLREIIEMLGPADAAGMRSFGVAGRL